MYSHLNVQSESSLRGWGGPSFCLYHPSPKSALQFALDVGYFTQGGDGGTLSCSLPSWLLAQQGHCRTFTGNGEGLSGLDHLRSVRISRNEVPNYSVGTWWWFCVLLVPKYRQRSWSIALHYRKRGGWASLLNLLASLLSPMLFLKPSQSAFVIIYVQEEHMAQPSCWALTLPNPRSLLNPFLGQTPGTAGRWTEKGTSGLPRSGDHTVNPSVFHANPPQYPSRGGKLVFTHIWRAQTCLFPAQFVE